MYSSAQIKQGAVLLGGQVSAYSNSIDYSSAQADQKDNSAMFNVTVGKALKENSVLGVFGGYGSFKVENYYNGSAFYNSNQDRCSLGVFYRLYRKIARDFYCFGELGAGYTRSNQTNFNLPNNDRVNYRQNAADLYLAPGIGYRLYKKLHVELVIPRVAGVQYGVTKMTAQSGNSKQDQFSFNTNLNSSLLNNIGLGLRLVL